MSASVGGAPGNRCFYPGPDGKYVCAKLKSKIKNCGGGQNFTSPPVIMNRSAGDEMTSERNQRAAIHEQSLNDAIGLSVKIGFVNILENNEHDLNFS